MPKPMSFRSLTATRCRRTAVRERFTASDHPAGLPAWATTWLSLTQPQRRPSQRPPWSLNWIADGAAGWARQPHRTAQRRSWSGCLAGRSVAACSPGGHHSQPSDQRQDRSQHTERNDEPDRLPARFDRPHRGGHLGGRLRGVVGARLGLHLCLELCRRDPGGLVVVVPPLRQRPLGGVIVGGLLLGGPLAAPELVDGVGLGGLRLGCQRFVVVAVGLAHLAFGGRPPDVLV